MEPSWVLERIDDAAVRVVDARSMPHGVPGLDAPTGAELYALGHLPGAVHIDYATDLHDPATPYAARVAPPERFAQVVGALGIGDETTIVAYDEGEVPYAARIVWMFRYYGHDRVSVMAGGYRAWTAAGLPLTSDVPSYPAQIFTPHVAYRLRATRDEVLAVATGRSDAQLLETQRDKTYALRDRDIANARRLSGNLLLEDAHGGRIAPAETLSALVDSLALDRRKRTIVSCGSGVSASGAYLALLEAGFRDVAVYDGSWMEWNHDKLPTTAKVDTRR
ncbi:MAG: sulfurtransferase [Candidatus Eremiobacteraeota bacterium]|nr:sulfurtransferase [Candidatus Eremiobacteraeota bacterium]